MQHQLRSMMNGYFIPAILLLLQILVLPIQCLAQSGWVRQASPTGTLDLHGVCFTDVNTGTIVGDSGVILRTTNAGESWIRQDSGTDELLLGVCFSSFDTGFAVGTFETVLRTTDGGDTWNRIIRPPSSLSTLYAVSAPTNSHITTVGTRQAILHSTDGGISWKDQDTSFAIAYYGVSFSDANNGTIVGSIGAIIRTTNGGAFWSQQSPGTTERLRGVCFTDSTEGSVVGTDGTILRTTNAGLTWSPQGGTEKSLVAISFVDSYNGAAVGVDGTIMRTTNGGEAWIRQESGVENALWGVSFTDSVNGTIVGLGGTILRTTTGGTTWVEDEKPTPSLFHLAQNYPNPVTTSTTIPFTLSKPEHVRLSVCDLLGREVTVLVDGERMAGEHSVPFHASGLRAGIYFSVLRTGSAVETRTMLVVE